MAKITGVWEIIVVAAVAAVAAVAVVAAVAAITVVAGCRVKEVVCKAGDDRVVDGVLTLVIFEVLTMGEE
jgi:hypothetical protein